MQFSSSGQGAGVLKFSSCGPCLDVEIVQSNSSVSPVFCDLFWKKSLWRNNIGDAGAKDIAAALEKNTTLTNLE